MKFIKKHKKLVIILIIVIILVILALSLIKVLSVDTSKSIYGDRLDGISKVKISDAEKKDLEKDLKSLEEVENVSSHVKGRIIDVYITFKEGTDINHAKEIANKVLEHFDDEEKKFYDIQIFLTTDKEAEGYPKIGYKHKTSEAIVW